MIPQHGTLDISRSRLAHNVALLRERIGGGVKLCATIKADAYGHGVGLVAPLLLQNGVTWCCTYSLDEAAAQASLGWEGILALAPLVMMRDPAPDEAGHLRTRLSRNVRINLTDAASARRLAVFARAHLNHPLNVHIQVDAGLTRIGIEPRDARGLADLVAELPGLQLEGLFAHFSHGDVPRHDTVSQQLDALQRVAEPLRSHFPHLMVHLQNSGGTWHFDPPAPLDMVRVGIALYGLQASMDAPIPGLQPIARVTAPILALHERPAGTGVGYGHTFVTERDSLLAVVPVGYADGYPRLLSNRCLAQVRGRAVPVVGRVSMDQIILDVTDLAGPARPQLGDPVTVISRDPADPNSLDAMATAIGTIGYELATHLGPRLKRVVGE